MAITWTLCDSAVPRLWTDCWTGSPDRTSQSALAGDSSWLWQRSHGPDEVDSRPRAAERQGRVGCDAGEEEAARGEEASALSPAVHAQVSQ